MMLSVRKCRSIYANLHEPLLLYSKADVKADLSKDTGKENSLLISWVRMQKKKKKVRSGLKLDQV